MGKPGSFAEDIDPTNDMRNTSTTNEPADSSTRSVDLETWRAWVDLLSEPAHFNVLLREYGVSGVKVQEVIALDEESLAQLPRPIHALVFLFQWKLSGREDIEGECPDKIWFAQQTADNSCATTALLNIVNNIPGLDLGHQLASFRQESLSLSSLDKGDALDSLTFVRSKHNSFATAGDIRDADIMLQEAAERVSKEEAAEERRQAAAAKRALKKTIDEAAVTRTSGRTNDGKRTGDFLGVTRAKRPRYDDDEEPANHFCAYMPIGDQLWKLDGLEPTPEMVCDTERDNTEAWLHRAVKTIQDHMASYADGSLAFNIMAVVTDPLVSSKKALSENVRAVQAIETKLTGLVEDWREMEADGDQVVSLDNGMSQEYGVSQRDVDEAGISNLVRQMSGLDDLAGLLELRKKAAAEQQALKAQIRQEQQSAKEDHEQAFFYRHDYDSFFDSWLDELGEIGALGPLLERYE